MIPSICAIFAIGWSGFSSVSGAFSAAWGSGTVIQFAVFLLIIDYMTTSGMSRWIAEKLLCLSFSRKNVWNLILFSYLAGFFIANVSNGVLASVIVWGMFSGVFIKCGFTGKDKFPSYYLGGLLVTSMIGSSLFPWQTVPLAAMNGYMNASGAVMEPMFLFMCRFPAAFLWVFAVWAFMRWVIRVDVTKLEEGIAAGECFESHSMKPNELIGFIAVGFLFLATCLPTFLPDGVLKTLVKDLGTTGVGIVMVLAFSIIHMDDKPLMNLPESFKRLNWSLLACVAATIPLCSFLESDKSGIVAAMTTLLKPALTGMSPLVYCAAVVVFATLVTQFTHNIVLAAVLSPLLVPLSEMAGVNPAIVTAMIISPCMTAILSPAASANAAFIFGLTEWVHIPTLTKFNMLLILFSMIFTLFFVPYYMFIS